MSGRGGLNKSQAFDKKAMQGKSEGELTDMMKNLRNTTGKKKRGGGRKRRNVDKNTVDTLLHSLNTKPKFTKMVEYSVECIKNLAIDESSVDEMIDDGVLDALFKVQKLNPYNEKINCLINDTLDKLCKNERLARVIGKKMGAAGFVLSMKKHVEPETLISTCRIASKLCDSKENVDMFVDGGMVDALSTVVKGNVGNEEVMAAATQALNKIAGEKDFAVRIMDSGSIEGVLEGLKKYPENATFVRDAVGLIAKIAQTSDELMEKLRKLGAVDIIVNALEFHPDDEDLLDIGAEALGALVREEDIASAMQVKTGVNLATANALAKISSLMLVDDNVDFMIKNNGIEWLLEALQMALGDKSAIASKILDAGCRALARICSSGDEHKIYTVMQKGGVKLLVAITQQHVEDEKVAASSIGALSKMVTRKENGVFIAKSGGVQAAMKAHTQHPDSERVAKAVLDFFSRLAAHETLVGDLVEAGVINDVVGILKAHGTNEDIALSCINTLGRMATSAENMQKIADAGGLEAFVQVLYDQQDNANVAKQALLMVETSTLLPSNIDSLRSLGAMDAVLGVLNAHPEDEEIQKIGASALARIAGEKEIQQAVNNMRSLAGQINEKPGMVKALVDKFVNSTNLVSNLAVVDANKPLLNKAGAVRGLVEAFEAAGKIPKGIKREQAFKAIAMGMLRLAEDPNARKEMLSSHATKSAMTAALQNPDDEELAELAMDLMARMAEDPANVQLLVADGAVEDIIALSKAHPQNQNILAAATRALGHLGADDTTMGRIVAAGGAEVVVESLYANMLNEAELVNAINVISAMALDDDPASLQALMDAQALQAILEAMKKYPDNAEVQAAGIQALCRLCLNEEVATAIGDQDGIPLLVKAMRDHYKNEGICEMDMILLDSLASVPENATRLLEEDLKTVELVKWVVEAYDKNVAMEESAMRLLETLDPQGPDIVVYDGDTRLDAAAAAELVAHLQSGQLSDAETIGYCDQIALLGATPSNAVMMVRAGGLQALAGTLRDNKNNEAAFYSAAHAFTTLADMGGDEALQVLGDPACVEALCEIIRPHPEFAAPMNLGDLTKAVAALAKLKLKPELVQEMMKNADLPSLMKIFCDSDDPMLLQQAARLLGKLSNDDNGAALLAKITNIRELIAAMRKNIKNEEFLKYGVYLLGNLALTDELKDEIGIEGGIQLILQVMKMYPNNEPLIENCCYALANLSFENSINTSFIVACKGIPILLACLQTHDKSVDLLESAICTLCNICHNENSNKDKIIKADGATIIVETVLNNFNSIELLLTSFRTLGNLASNRENISAIIKAGGVQGIVAGMTVHNEELDIIDVAIRVLTNLASDLNEENQAIMAQEGAVQAVVEVTETYYDNLDMERSAIGCLQNLARESYNAEMILKQGGVEAAIKVSQELSYDAPLVSMTLGLLAQLSTCVNEIDRMHEGGATAGITAAVQTHPTEVDILLNGMGALGNMAYNDATATAMAKQGAIQLVLGIIKQHANNPDVLVGCYKCLSALCRSEANSKQMAEVTMAALVKNMEAHPTHAGLTLAGFSYVGNLCVASAAAEFALPTGIVAAILTTANYHKQTPGTIIRGMRAVENIAYCQNKGVRAQMKKTGVPKLIEPFKSNRADVTTACKKAINAINRTDIEVGDLNFMSISKPVKKNNDAKKLFSDGDSRKLPELTQAIKNFLTAGALLTKHSVNAPPRARHVYISEDLKYFVWKNPKKPVSDENRCKVFKLKSVDAGRQDSVPLNRKRRGKFMAKEECAFTVSTRERTVDLEAASEHDRQQWIDAMEALIRHAKAVKEAKKNFANAFLGRDLPPR